MPTYNRRRLAGDLGWQAFKARMKAIEIDDHAMRMHALGYSRALHHASKMAEQMEEDPCEE